MFKKAGDNVHYLERTGSHATKGRATGLVEQRKLDETDFHSDAANLLRWARIKELKKLRSVPNRDYWRIIEILKVCDSATRNGLISTLKHTRKRIRELNLEIAELRAVTEKPVGKVKKIFSSPKERRQYYSKLHREKNKKQKRLTE